MDELPKSLPEFVEEASGLELKPHQIALIESVMHSKDGLGVRPYIPDMRAAQLAWFARPPVIADVPRGEYPHPPLVDSLMIGEGNPFSYRRRTFDHEEVKPFATVERLNLWASLYAVAYTDRHYPANFDGWYRHRLLRPIPDMIQTQYGLFWPDVSKESYDSIDPLGKIIQAPWYHFVHLNRKDNTQHRNMDDWIRAWRDEIHRPSPTTLTEQPHVHTVYPGSRNYGEHRPAKKS